jgi:sugar phosphate isomerase/epimerase
MQPCSIKVLDKSVDSDGRKYRIKFCRTQQEAFGGPSGRSLMPRKYSLAHLTVMGCPPPEMTYIAARAGYDHVSFRLIHLGLPGEPNYALAENPAMLRQTRTALRDTGLTMHDLELAHIHDDIDPKRFRPAMEVAAELGAKGVISSIWTPDRAFATACFAEICDLGRPLGLTVDLEFPTWAAVVNLQQAVDVLRAVHKPNAGIMVDTLHFHRSRVALAELEALPPGLFHFAHICDAPDPIPTTREELIHTGRDERLYLGEGAIDVAGIIGRLPADTVLSIELPHLARVKEMGYAEHAWRCLETAKKYFARHAMS